MAAEVRDAVGFADLIDPTARAFLSVARRRSASRAFTIYPLADPLLADVMIKAGVVEDEAVFVVKVAPWYSRPAGAAPGQDGLFVIFDAATGAASAVIEDGHYISDIRTAAAGALAARYLAPALVRTAGIVGTGRQAELQALALAHERAFKRLLVWGRRRAAAEDFLGRLAVQLPAMDIRIAPDVETLVRSSDVVVTATASREPLVEADWMRPGQHFTAIGADDADKCELDPGCLLRAEIVVVDELEASAATGEVRRAREAGFELGDRVVEFGAVLEGRRTGRKSSSDVTIATFCGVGAQDVTAASAILAALA